jgi:hypothetical protein
VEFFRESSFHVPLEWIALQSLIDVPVNLIVCSICTFSPWLIHQKKFVYLSHVVCMYNKSIKFLYPFLSFSCFQSHTHTHTFSINHRITVKITKKKLIRKQKNHNQIIKLQLHVLKELRFCIFFNLKILCAVPSISSVVWHCCALSGYPSYCILPQI